MNSAVLLAAGSGQRMKNAVADKTLAHLAGLPAITYSLRAFAECGAVDTICVVYRDDAQKTEILEIISREVPSRIEVTWAQGGSERRDSVYNGLQALPINKEGVVLIHDCARPLIKPESILELIEAASSDGGACLAHPVIDTIKRIPEAGQTTATELEDLERDRLWAMETPQAFLLPKIRQAYESAVGEDQKLTDDTAVAAQAGLSITLVPNTHPNPKITTAADLDYIGWLLSK